MQASDGSALVKNGHVVRGKGVALEKELPVIEYDLVPLSLLVQRVTGQTYTDLVNLAEMFVVLSYCAILVPTLGDLQPAEHARCRAEAQDCRVRLAGAQAAHQAARHRQVEQRL